MKQVNKKRSLSPARHVSGGGGGGGGGGASKSGIEYTDLSCSLIFTLSVAKIYIYIYICKAYFLARFVPIIYVPASHILPKSLLIGGNQAGKCAHTLHSYFFESQN